MPLYLLQDKLSCSWNMWMEWETREGATLRCWHAGVIQNTLRAKYWSVWRSDQMVEKFSSAWGHPRILEFHHVITEEWGSVNKQHFWDGDEKAEIFFHGPYFPHKSQGEQSDVAVVQQTQELLETDTVSADWNIYMFSHNSPCLGRKAEPCMLVLALRRKWEFEGHMLNKALPLTQHLHQFSKDFVNLQLIELKTCSRRLFHIVNLLTLYHKWCITIILEWSFYIYSQIFQ